MRTSPPDPSRRHSSEICPSDVRYWSGQEQQGHCDSAAGWDGRAALQVPASQLWRRPPSQGRRAASATSPSAAALTLRPAHEPVRDWSHRSLRRRLCVEQTGVTHRGSWRAGTARCAGPTVAGIGTTVAQVAPAAGYVEPASPAIRPRSARVPPGRCRLWPQNRAMRRLSPPHRPAIPAGTAVLSREAGPPGAIAPAARAQEAVAYAERPAGRCLFIIFDRAVRGLRRREGWHL